MTLSTTNASSRAPVTRDLRELKVQTLFPM